MGVESPIDANRPDEDLATFHDQLGSEDIAFVDGLSSEIEAVIENTTELQRYEYVIGDVSDYSALHVK